MSRGMAGFEPFLNIGGSSAAAALGRFFAAADAGRFNTATAGADRFLAIVVLVIVCGVWSKKHYIL